MKTTPEFREQEIHKHKVGTFKLVNGLLAIGTMHYMAWIVYKLITWII